MDAPGPGGIDIVYAIPDAADDDDPGNDLAAVECRCPVCVDNARRGIPRIILGADGEPVELPPLELPPMVAVTVRGSASTWPELTVERQTLEVPAGCSVADLLAFIQYRNDELLRSFGPGALRATLDGAVCPPTREVRAGDEFRLVGNRAAGWRQSAGMPALSGRRPPSSAEPN